MVLKASAHSELGVKITPPPLNYCVNQSIVTHRNLQSWASQRCGALTPRPTPRADVLAVCAATSMASSGSTASMCAVSASVSTPRILASSSTDKVCGCNVGQQRKQQEHAQSIRSHHCLDKTPHCCYFYTQMTLVPCSFKTCCVTSNCRRFLVHISFT